MDYTAKEPLRHALLIDEENRWVRRPADLISAIVALIAIAGIMLIAVYGYSTTLAVTRDVRTATDSIVETILLIPINTLEGAVGFFLPLTIIGDLMWHRRWQTLATATAACATTIAVSYGLLWLFTKYFPLSPITGQLGNSLTEQSYLQFLPYVSILSAIITVASSGKATRTTRIAWPLLSVVLVLSVLQGNQALSGALITLALGVLFGLLARYIAGDVPDRADGLDLVRLAWKAGVDAQLIVRIDSADPTNLHAWIASARTRLGYVDQYGVEQIRLILQKAGEQFGRESDTAEALHSSEASPPAVLPYTKVSAERTGVTEAGDVEVQKLRDDILSAYHPALSDEASRSYVVVDRHGVPYLATTIDVDQHVVGVLRSSWNRIVLTTTARHTASSISESANRVALMELATSSRGIGHDRDMVLAGSDKSHMILTKIDESIPLSQLPPEDVPDEAVDQMWDILNAAHLQGLSHGNIHAGVTTLRENELELVHWENGSVTATEIERRIDMAQAMAMLAGCVGIDRAVASASRCLPRDQVVSLAPILHKAIIPQATRRVLADKKQLELLRDRLNEHVPEAAEAEPTQLYRFKPKTVITTAIGVIAIYVLLGSVNFEELKETLANATPSWMAFAFAAGLFTYVGAAMTLRAYTAEKLSMRETTIVQVAASLVTLVAPAGIGPAALNLRFLQKRKVSTPIAVATVSLVQVAQFVTTIVVLLILSLATGEIGALTAPSPTIIVAILVAILGVASLFLIGPLRRWVAQKVRPSIDQVWPRIVWLATHPSRLVYGFFGSVIQSIAFIACFGGALASFGYTLPIVTLSVTYLVSNSVGSVVPSPGGIGPVEAALTGGLTLAGVPASIALSTAVLYRLLTFWGRVPLGWIALRYLTKREVI